MTQSEIIMKQVALKAAVELTKDKFDPNNDIANQLEVIRNISNNLFNYLKIENHTIDLLGLANQNLHFS